MNNDRVKIVAWPVLIGMIPLFLVAMIGMKVLGAEQQKNEHQDRQIEENKAEKYRNVREF